MSKSKSGLNKLKYLLLAFVCAASFPAAGILASCSDDDDDEDTATTSVEDTQLLKNGNFEYYSVPDDAVYLIKTPLNWSSGGSTSYTMSGIIGTSDSAWAKLSDGNLKATLDANNELDEDDDDYEDLYVDYNGMTSNDILYKDVYAALNTDESDETYASATALIDNPGTHYDIKGDANGGYYYTDGDGTKVTLYTNSDDEDDDNDDNLYTDEDCTKSITNILMIHNYVTSRNGLTQNYESVSVDLPANTAAEISFWVKTTSLRFSQGTDVSQDRGAYVSVEHTVGSTTLDNFTISKINTEKLISEGAVDSSNGWVQYTVYVNSCNFADTTVTIELGLGESDYMCEGYAFFDDVTVTKYVSIDDTSYGDYEQFITDNGCYCTLLSDESEKVFKVDSYKRNNSASVSDERYSKFTRFYLDLTADSEYAAQSLDGISAGLTVDDDDYISSKSIDNPTTVGDFTVTPVADGAKLPSKLVSLDISSDLLALVTAGTLSNLSGYEYYDGLKGELSSVSGLPNADGSSEIFLIVSAYGAAYTATLSFEIAKDEYKIISYWVKTSDTSVSISLTQDGKKSNATSDFSLNTTDITTDIDDDNEDIYSGWVQCFFFVSNETDETATYTFSLSYGNTTIKDTDHSGYSAGWAALANMQVLDVDEDTFDLTSTGDYAYSFKIAEPDEYTTTVFDEAYGSESNAIKEGIVNPSNYSGVNGNSSSVVVNDVISLPFDDINTNEKAGLINKEYVETYFADNDNWYNSLCGIFNVSTTDALTSWNEIFGSSCTQPLIIINDTLRTGYVIEKGADSTTYVNYYIRNDDGTFSKVSELEDYEYDEDETYYSLQKILNYGFIGSTTSVSSDSYTVITVRVKVSKYAVAYVYLTDGTSDKNVLSLVTPSYTFYYDEDGNVLKEKPDDDATLAEQKANILYTLRSDGLYEDENGTLYANVWNYSYFYKDSSVKYYDRSGSEVSFDDLDSDTVYYTDASHTVESTRYLVTTDGIKVYLCENNKYYYIVEGEVTDEVKPFDTSYARYDYSSLDVQYMTKIDGAEHAGEWVTVTYAFATGSESKSYRLELWSGTRDNYYDSAESIATAEAGGAELVQKSAVIFDYSYDTIDEDNFSTLLSDYESKIIDGYIKLLAENDLFTGVTSLDENILYYENLVEGFVESGDISEEDYEALKSEYAAYYYMFTLYDSANFSPYNEDVAEDEETGYDYTINDFSESLLYLSVYDSDSKTYTVFTDYSTVNQSIDKATATDDEDDDEDDDADATSVWLLISSIVLVVVLIFTMLSILVRDLYKKARRRRTFGKNVYQQKNRAIRRLRINEEVIEEVDNPALQQSEGSDEGEAPADDTEADGGEAEESPSDSGEADDESPADGDVQ